MNIDRDFDVFISYSAASRLWAHELVAALHEHGVRAWYDEEIAPGEKWVDQIETALRDSPALVFILTRESSLESPWIFFEIGAAIAGKKRIIPVLVDDLPPERIPRVLYQYQFLRESSPAVAAERIAAVLKTMPANAAA